MRPLRIEHRVSVFFSNAKWIWISLESLIELYLYIKIYLDDFPGRLKQAELAKSRGIIHFEFQCQKVLRLYHNTYISYSA